jgi:hypothetical protein
MKFIINFDHRKDSSIAHDDMLVEIRLVKELCKNLSWEMEKTGFMTSDRWNLFNEIEKSLQIILEGIQQDGELLEDKR